MANRMILNETAWFGRGAINALTDEVARRGYRKALIVTDSTLARCGVAAKVTDKLDAAGLAWDMFSDVIPNPTIAVVQQGLQAFQRSGADYLIAIGGGSPQDTCKAIGIIQRNPEFADVRSLEGLSPTRQPSVPIFSVPTSVTFAALSIASAASIAATKPLVSTIPNASSDISFSSFRDLNKFIRKWAVCPNYL